MPVPGPGQVRVRTVACGICATDLEMIDGWDRTGYPSVPGHEWSGIVDDIGPHVDPALLGCPCVAENVLADGGEVGFEHVGAYSECFLTEADNVYTLPVDFSLSAATLIEPLAVCIRGLRRLRRKPAGPTLVFGDGPIGLLMLLLLKAEHVDPITIVGGRPARLTVASELGATTVLNYHDGESQVLSALTAVENNAFPTVVEASGSDTAMRMSLDAVAQAGSILVLGDYGDRRADFKWNTLLHRELEIVGSNASRGAWPEGVAMAVNQGLPLEALVSQRVSAPSFKEAIALTRRSRDVIKVVMEWPEQTVPHEAAAEEHPPS